MKFYITLMLFLGGTSFGIHSDSRFKRETRNVSWETISGAIQAGNVNRIKEWIRSGVDFSIKNQDEWTPLILAASEGQDKIAELLITNSAHVNEKTRFGYTALHVAVQENHETTVDLLLKNGADIDLANSDGWTPLFTACSKGLDKMAELLIGKGADVNIQNRYGYKALDIALQKGNERIAELLRNGVEKFVKNENSALNRIAQRACEMYSQQLRPFHISDRVLGGELAAFSEFPWMAALGYIDNSDYEVTFDCGGTIISESFVLTAAHCVRGRQPVVIRLGKRALTDKDGIRPVNRQIKEIISHPNYSLLTKRNDIALIRMTRNITFSSNIMPACLQTNMRDEQISVKLIVTGWGSISAERTVRSTDLLKTQLISMPLLECNSTFLNYSKQVNHAAFRDGLIEGQYCAYDPQGKNDSCQGDSGGPLQFFNASSSTATVVGIVSFGISCGTLLPGIYTRVAYYLDWIEPFVWPNL